MASPERGRQERTAARRADAVPSIVDFTPTANSGNCTSVTVKRLKPDGSGAVIVGSSNSGSPVSTQAGVWSKSLGGTYTGEFAYGLFDVPNNCNSWPDISYHVWIDSSYGHAWEPAATQYWPGAVNGSMMIWMR